MRKVRVVIDGGYQLCSSPARPCCGPLCRSPGVVPSGSSCLAYGSGASPSEAQPAIEKRPSATSHAHKILRNIGHTKTPWRVSRKCRSCASSPHGHFRHWSRIWVGNFMALTTQPFANAPELRQPLDRIRDSLEKNVELPERIGSVAAGAALALFGLSRRSWSGLALALLGGGLLYRGSTGYCALYHQLGINSRQMNTEAGVPDKKGIKIESTVTVERPP